MERAVDAHSEESDTFVKLLLLLSWPIEYSAASTLVAKCKEVGSEVDGLNSV